MELKVKNIAIITLILLVIVILILVILSKKTKEKKQEELETIRDTIISGHSTSDNTISGSLLNIKPDPNYDATKDADSLIGAIGGWLSQDKDQVVFETLSGKTKAQLKSIDLALLNNHGISLEEFIADIFGEVWDIAKKDRAENIIKSAT